MAQTMRWPSGLHARAEPEAAIAAQAVSASPRMEARAGIAAALARHAPAAVGLPARRTVRRLAYAVDHDRGLEFAARSVRLRGRGRRRRNERARGTATRTLGI